MGIRSFGLALAASLVVSGGCGKSSTSPPAAATEGVTDVLAANLVVPAFELTDEAGQPFASDQLAGRVWIANFIFTRCAATCPIQTGNLARLQQKLAGDPAAADVRYISVSVDPEHDQPAVLDEYAKQHKANTSTWKFLTGDRGKIYSLSKDGFKLPVIDGSDNSAGIISHSPQFALVNRDGKIVGLYDGTKQSAMAALEKRLRELLAAAPVVAAATAAAAVQAPSAAASPAAPPKIVYFPPGVEKTDVEPRRAEQMATLNQFKVFHDFTFTDKQPASGLDFLNRFVDDAGKNFKAVHYDHGTGLAVADVDRDGLSDVYFVSQIGPSGLYRNLGGGKFEDITQKAGVAVSGQVCVSASFADIDNDGDADLYVTCVRSPNVLFENNGDGTFKNISAASGLAYNEHSSSAEFFDYNRDGRLDMFLTVIGQYTTDEKGQVTGTVNEERSAASAKEFYRGQKDAFGSHLIPSRTRLSHLFRNDGGNKFTDVTRQVGLVVPAWSGDATPTDFNGDGWPDLYVLNMQGHDEYWVNENGQRFVNKSREVFPKTPWGAMGAKSFDYDNDGDVDLFITDMHSDMSKNIPRELEKQKAGAWINENWTESFLKSEGNSIFGNAFYRNKGDGTFEEVSDALGAETYWPWGLSVGDLNADGWQDAYITAGMNYPFEFLPNNVLINNAGEKFLESAYILGAEPRLGGRVVKPWYQLACGGADQGHDLCKGQTGDVIVYGVLGSRSSAMFDVDNDGDLDIVTNEWGDHPMLLVSNLGEKRGQSLHFVKVKLTGTKSNRDALGARVTVTAGGRRWLQIHDGQSGYLGQSSLPLYFGLGDAGQIDRIDVTWPSGESSNVTFGLKINDVIEITEPN